MRVKLQLVLCSEDGREETVADIVSWNKDSHRLEYLGLTLAEAKQLLKRIQKKLLEQQIARFLATHSQCPDCGAPLKAKNYTNRSFRTLFGGIVSSNSLRPTGPGRTIFPIRELTRTIQHCRNLWGDRDVEEAEAALR